MKTDALVDIYAVNTKNLRIRRLDHFESKRAIAPKASDCVMTIERLGSCRIAADQGGAADGWIDHALVDVLAEILIVRT